MTRAANPSTEAARALVDALIFHGVRHVVLSPGSRSAPLAYALARAERRERIEVHVRIDERVAAFTALGLARFGPAAVVTTSGTAAANLHPALLEARHSGLGLLAITADRPHELRGVGANQTTDQLHMFGPHIPAVEIPAGSTRAAIGNQAARILAQATGAFGPPGPVHVNIAFRDPLVPGAGDGEEEGPITAGPRVRVRRATMGAGEVDVRLPSVVVAGDGAGPEAARFAEAAGLPLLAEPSSGARAGANAIGPYQRRLPALASEVAQVIGYGRPTLSRPVSGLLASAEHVTVVADHPEWVDVRGRAEQIVAGVDAAGSADPRWLARWREREREVAQEEAAGAGLAAQVLAHALGRDQVQAMIGSSMAIRYADIHGPVGSGYTRAPVYAARGLAGIDGTIAAASGIALGSGPIRVITGDLTFAHDVGALALGPGERSPELQVVVLNDGGGGIFANLEHGEEPYEATFDRFFATPVPLVVEHVAAAYGYEYRKITDPARLPEVLTPRIEGRSIVEVQLPPVSGDSQKPSRNVSA